jgi:VWFA-related protein
MNTNIIQICRRAGHIALIGACIVFTAVLVYAQDSSKNQNKPMSVLVTAVPTNDRTRSIADKLETSDFEIFENERKQLIISSRKAGEIPPTIAILIQDDLVGRVSLEIPEIKKFIRGLPEGTRVMTGYITTGTLQVRQAFTTDRDRAADSLRILLSTQSAAPYDPYIEVIEALKLFDQPATGRNMILLISDGLDATGGLRHASPMSSVDLDRAIVEAQRRNVSIFTMYAPSVGLTSYNRLAVNYGQSSLNRIADETGGTAFFSGMDFVTFDPYFRELNDLTKYQWLITYQSDNSEKGFRKIEVRTDFDIHLQHTPGYKIR